MKGKKAITITSLVIYVILLFLITTFVVIISNNLNSRLFSERGLSINITELNKLQYNLFNSSKKSNNVSVLATEIAFLNGDIYDYNSESNVILKNGTVLIDNVTSFKAESSTNSRGTLIKLTIKVNKYLNEVEKEIVIFVEE